MAREKRYYELLIGIPVVVAENFFSPEAAETDRVLQLEDYYDEKAPASYKITENDLSYEIIKTATPAKDKCSITIKNLHPDTIQYVMDNKGKNLYIEFDVGYVGEVKNLFKGTVQEAFYTHTRTERILTLKIVDGAVNGQAHTVRSYPKDTPYDKIIDDIRKDLALPVGRVVPLEGTFKTATAISLFGNSCEKMAAITDQFDYNFSIGAGLCYILPKDGMLTEQAAYISSETGLIGNVQDLVVRGNTTSKTGLDQGGARRKRFTCQTDAAIAPQLSVYLYDPETDVDGVYKVEKCKFNCSGFEKGSYIVIVDCIENDKLIRSA